MKEPGLLGFEQKAKATFQIHQWELIHEHDVG